MILICINSISATRAHDLAVIVNTRLGPAAKCPTCSRSWLLTTAERARLDNSMHAAGNDSSAEG